MHLHFTPDKSQMKAAGIEGAHASPKGLRYGFVVIHALNKTPLPTLQRWLGHSDPTTKAIYMQAVGDRADASKPKRLVLGNDGRA